jgi:hypothetical protein
MMQVHYVQHIKHWPWQVQRAKEAEQLEADLTSFSRPAAVS